MNSLFMNQKYGKTQQKRTISAILMHSMIKRNKNAQLLQQSLKNSQLKRKKQPNFVANFK